VAYEPPLELSPLSRADHAELDRLVPELTRCRPRHRELTWAVSKQHALPLRIESGTSSPSYPWAWFPFIPQKPRETEETEETQVPKTAIDKSEKAQQTQEAK
jgi:hypothetical protein